MARKAPNMPPVQGYKRPPPTPAPPKPPEARIFVSGERIYPPYAPSPRQILVPQESCSKIEVKESSLWCLLILGFLLGSMSTLIIYSIFMQR